MNRYLIAVFLVLVSANAAPAQDPERINGQAVALDGDTLQIGDRRIRLWGIDTAEMKDRPAGPLARAALDDLIAGWTVACEVRDTDRYKRAVAICGTPETHDLSIALLKAGQATAYRTFTQGWPEAVAYDDAERTARAVGLGIWVRDEPKPENSWIDILQGLTIPFAAVAGFVAVFIRIWLQNRQHGFEMQVARLESERRSRTLIGLLGVDLGLVHRTYRSAFFKAAQICIYWETEIEAGRTPHAPLVGAFPVIQDLFWLQENIDWLDGNPEILKYVQNTLSVVTQRGGEVFLKKEYLAEGALAVAISYAKYFGTIADMASSSGAIADKYSKTGIVDIGAPVDREIYVWPTETYEMVKAEVQKRNLVGSSIYGTILGQVKF